MKYGFFNLVATISLLLAVTSAALWLRSYWHRDGVWRDGGKTRQSLVSDGGRLEYGLRHGFNRGQLTWQFQSTAFPRMTRYQSMETPTTWYGHLGFSYSNSLWQVEPGWIVHDVDATLPHWPLAVFFFIFPACHAIAWWRHRGSRARGFEVSGATATA